MLNLKIIEVFRVVFFENKSVLKHNVFDYVGFYSFIV